MSKGNFKALVKKSVKEACFRHLCSEKIRLSKGKEIKYDSFDLQPYFKPENALSIDNMRKIYHIRTREIYIKANFPSAFKDTNCLIPSCTDRDEQTHIFNSSCFSEVNELAKDNIEYTSIFGQNVSDQMRVMNILFGKLERRMKLFNPNHTGSSKDPSKSKLGIQKVKSRNTNKLIFKN